MKLGKTPARPNAVSMKLTSYLTRLPVAPKVFGHEALISSFGMLGNDQYGDCVWAGAGHETMLWNREAGKTVAFTDKAVLSDYSKVTGFNPKDPNSDQGTDMQKAASYRRKTGVIDAKGVRHQVGGYLAVDKGSITNHATAAYLFGAVGVGIEFPNSAMDQFNDGQPWDVVRGAKVEGGHYIPLVGRNARGNFLVITWGRVQEMTPAFLAKYNDESIVYLSAEALKSGKSPEGFNLTQLTTDLKAL